MASAPGAALVLVCPTCGKKYRGNPEKPDGRYQCPDDQSTLTKFAAPQAASVTAPAPPQERRADPPPPPPDFNMGGSSQPETSDTQRDFASTMRVDTPAPGYSGGRDPLLASAHDDLAPDEAARRAADAIHENVAKMDAGIDQQTVFVGNETAAGAVPTPLPTPAPDSATVVAGSRTYSAHEVPTHTPTKMSSMPTQTVESPMLTEEGTFTGFFDRRSVVSVMEGAFRPDVADADAGKRRPRWECPHAVPAAVANGFRPC